MHRALAALVVMAALAAGCASRGSVRQLSTDLTAVRSDAAAVRQAQEQAAREHAQTLAELRALDARVRQLGDALSAASAEVARLRTAVGEQEAALERVQAEVAARPVPAAAPAPPPERPPAVAAPRPGAAEAAYASALGTFRAREHGQAVLEFLDFIARHPRHALAANAQYWIGEAYYVQRDYRQALSEFQKVLDYPNVNGKAADAMLKIGLCYVNLREPARAQQAWQKLIGEHPSSPAATRARALLRGRRSATR